MDSQPLTGKDAVEALSLVTKLGNENARFDRRRLHVALRSRAGRLRIMAGLALRAVVPERFHVVRAERASKRARSASQKAVRGSLAPDRPRPSTSPRERENGS